MVLTSGLLPHLNSMVGSMLFIYKQVLSDVRRCCPAIPQRLGWRVWGSLVAILLAFLAGGVVFMPDSLRWGNAELCRSPQGAMTQRALHSGVRDGPAALWARFKDDFSSSSLGESASVALRKCIAWQPKRGSIAPPSDRMAQLECHAALMQRESSIPSESERLALTNQVRELLRTPAAIIQRCDSLLRSLSSLRAQAASGKNQANLLNVMIKWANFEGELRDAVSIIEKATEVLKQRVATGDVEAEKDLQVMQVSPSSRKALQRCMIRGSREARLITSQLKHSAAVQQAEACHSTRLKSIECLAVANTEAEVEVATVFDRGLLVSEIATATDSAPFFRGPSSCCEVCQNVSSNAEDSAVPNGIVAAETLLSRGYELASAHERTEKAVLRAIQLCKHAEHLAKSGAEESVIERRFHCSAALASEVGRDKLAAGILAKFSNVLSKRGLQEAALEAADKAVALASDPLASLQQVSLRFSLWKLKSGSDVIDAAQQLSVIPRGLLNKVDEKARIALRARLLTLYEAVEATSIFKCLILGDVAHVFACMFGKLLYA
eukprot:TRINITY_DN30999_c0_g1_i1.p1 TRINITY_DN30999_c0_g1~~TRINITY_DN30999_c0_g1_i1.p1  ORF type:complete len:551 (-),score=80.40 TRINITY_DN30999_c0_g1_i1:38-1690(-)